MIKETNHKVQAISKVMNASLARLGNAEQILLVHLWQNWSVVIGDELVNLVYPLGHNNSTLNVGGDDSVSLQEISMQRTEILERVNAFMESDFFTDVNICLVFGKTPLNMLMHPQNDNGLAVKRNVIPLCTGKHLALMQPDSAVARCYAKFSSLNK